MTITGTTTTLGFTVDIPAIVVTDIPGKDVPFSEGEVDADELTSAASGGDVSVVFSNVSSSVDASGYDGNVGSQVLLDLSGDMTATTQGITVNSTFAYHYVYELVSK